MVVRRLLLLVAALGLALASLVAPALPASAQDTTDPSVSTTAADATTASTAAPAGTGDVAPDDTGQTVLESPSSDQRLATENRRVLAVIGGLVVVAIALTLLTIRYARATRPVAGGEAPPSEPRRRRRSRKAVAGADHASADDDWQPRATGEHTAVAPKPATPFARPGAAARRRALDLPADG
ncbi:MAG: hypothetical protein KDA97_10485 [Acidimicrobiales bacterium]|nr:hypothetical protein [Acidimicrobiales bacterium]